MNFKLRIVSNEVFFRYFKRNSDLKVAISFKAFEDKDVFIENRQMIDAQSYGFSLLIIITNSLGSMKKNEWLISKIDERGFIFKVISDSGNYFFMHWSIDTEQFVGELGIFQEEFIFIESSVLIVHSLRYQLSFNELSHNQ